MKSPLINSSSASRPGFTFGEFRLEPDGTLLHQNSPVHVPPKELAALRLLLQHAGQIVTPRQLQEELWGDVHVTADSVPRCISSLRARLESEHCIQTVYKQGYRLIWPVQAQVETPVSSLPRLAIMPFTAGPNVPEHLGHALAEEATARLTAMRPPLFSMLARDSVFTLATKGMSAQQVGEELKADLVMTGTVHALVSKFRVRAEMVRVADGTQIWVEDLLLPGDQAAELPTHLVDRFAFRCGQALSDPTGPGERTLIHPQAYEMFLRGRHELQSFDRHRMQDGIRDLHRAMELEPKLTQARSDLVRAYMAQDMFGYLSPGSAADHVRRIAQDVSNDFEQCEALLPALGWLAFHVDRDLVTALRNFALSAHLPFDPWRTRLRALFAVSRQRFQEAADLLQEGLEVDPFSPWLNAALAWVWHFAGRGDESVRQIERCLDMFPEHAATRIFGGIILAFNGQAERAISLTKELARHAPNFDMAVAVHAYALACHGDREQAEDALERLQWLSRERFVMRSFTAAAYLALGNAEASMEELKAADEDRCPWFFLTLADPRLAALQDVPEFQQMRGRLTEMETAAGKARVNSSEYSEIAAK